VAGLRWAIAGDEPGRHPTIHHASTGLRLDVLTLISAPSSVPSRCTFVASTSSRWRASRRSRLRSTRLACRQPNLAARPTEAQSIRRRATSSPRSPAPPATTAATTASCAARRSPWRCRRGAAVHGHAVGAGQ
jgi:hypothetical protein